MKTQNKLQRLARRKLAVTPRAKQGMKKAGSRANTTPAHQTNEQLKVTALPAGVKYLALACQIAELLWKISLVTHLVQPIILA